MCVTFLGVCADFVSPASDLIMDDAQACSSTDSEIMSKILQKNMERCSALFEHYRKIVGECSEALTL